MSADYRIRPADKPDAPPITFRAKNDDMARYLFRVGVNAAVAKGRAITPMVMERFDPVETTLIIPGKRKSDLGVWTEVRVDAA